MCPILPVAMPRVVRDAATVGAGEVIADFLLSSLHRLWEVERERNLARWRARVT
jgi:hypothetical protein